MPGHAYFIRCHHEHCAIIKLHPDGREEMLEERLTLAEAEELYFIRIGKPGHENSARATNEETQPPNRPRRPRQLAFKF